MASIQDGFFDQFIQGWRRNYFFDIRITGGRSIAGGPYFYKNEARVELRRALTEFLRDPGKTLFAPVPLSMRHRLNALRYTRPKLIASK